MQKIEITWFGQGYYHKKKQAWGVDNKVRDVQFLTWQEVVAEFTQMRTFAKKEMGKMFSFNHYKTWDDDPDTVEDFQKKLYVRKTGNNVVDITALMLDFENREFSIEDFKKLYSHIKHVGYTTYSHLSDKKNGAECFRVIIPLHCPIPKEIMPRLAPTLVEMFPKIDTSCFDIGRGFYVPSCHPSQLKNAVTWSNEGDVFDWSELKQHDVEVFGEYVPPETTGNVSIGGKGKILYHTMDILSFSQNNMLRPKHASGGWYEVDCPFAHEHTDGSRRGAFVKNASSKGPSSFHCKHSHQKKTKDFIAFFRQQSGNEVFRPYCECEEIIEKKPEPIKQAFLSLEELEKIQKEERAFYKQKYSELAYAVLDALQLLYSPEGSGKSMAAANMMDRGIKILFLCKSHDQAKQKLRDFAKQGFVGVHLRSKERVLKEEYGVSFVRANSDIPWTQGKIDYQETAIELIKTMRSKGKIINFEEAFKIIKKAARDSVNTKKVDFVVTSYVQGQIILNKRLESDADSIRSFVAKYRGTDIELPEEDALEKLLIFDDEEEYEDFVIGDGWVVFIDDPDPDDFMTLSKMEKDYEADKLPDNLIIEELGQNEKYWRRPEIEVLGKKMQRNVPIVFTTTELITKHLIETHYPGIKVVDLMQDTKVCKITILGTRFVRRRYDGMFFPLLGYLRQNGFDVELIQDGVGSKLNHSNSKGQNQLAKQHILCEVSVPHMSKVLTLHRETGIELKSIKYALMIDTIHQGVGRNQGAGRFCGFEAVVFVDPKFHKSLTDDKGFLRYAFDKDSSVIIDRNKFKPKRFNGPASDLVKSIEGYLMTCQDRLFTGELLLDLNGFKFNEHTFKQIVTAVQTVWTKDIHIQQSYGIRAAQRKSEQTIDKFAETQNMIKIDDKWKKRL